MIARRLAIRFWIVILCIPLVAGPAAADVDDPWASTYSLSDWGGVGLLETRTARFAPDGEFDIGVSLVNPHRRYFLNWQILPWMETTFRYVDFTNTTFAPDGSVALRPSMSDPDFFLSLFRGIPGGDILGRQFDVRFRLREESRYLPALAVGLQDFVGTSEFGGEYIVASKRWYDLDFSLGMGWGYFAGRGTLPNPMRVLSSRFRERDADVGLGGRFNIRDWFSGEDVGIFGGVEYTTPLEGLTIKAEYNSATNLTPLGADPEFADFPLGVAVNWRPTQIFEASVGLERGNTVMLRAALRLDLHDEDGIIKIEPDPPPMYVRPESVGLPPEVVATASLGTSVSEAVDRLFDGLAVNGIEVENIEAGDGIVEVTVGTLGTDQVRIVERAARAVVELFPDEVAEIAFVQSGAAIYGQDVRFSTSDLRRRVVEEEIGNILADRSIHLDRIVYADSLADIRITGFADTSARFDQIAIAAALFEALPEATDTIYVRDPFGLGWSADRAPIERGQMAERLFDVIESRGLEVSDIEMTAESATVMVNAPPWVGAEDYREAATMTAEALGDTIPIDFVAYSGDGEVARYVTTPFEDQATEIPEIEEDQVVFSLHVEDPRTTREIADDVFEDLDENNLGAESILIRDREAVLYLEDSPYLQEARTAGRIARIMSGHLPDGVERISIANMRRGIEVSRLSFWRHDVERMYLGMGSAEEVWAGSELVAGAGSSVDPEAIQNPARYPRFSWSAGPIIRHHLGSPEGLAFADVIMTANATVRPFRGMTVTGGVGQFLFGNIDALEVTTPSVLKPVRSLILDFQQEGRSSVTHLEADYVFSPLPNLYARFGVGLFEQMYGGIGGELYWHEMDSPFAVGLNLYWLRQRDFDGGLGFRDLEATTGHLSLYYDLPFYDLQTRIDFGRYLAGDWGATLDVSREFRSGVTVGAFATITEVSAEDFGEGSFDRGFYIRFPLELLTFQATTAFESFLFRPVSRDGGQTLNGARRLPGIVRVGERSDYVNSWHRFRD